MKSYYAVYLSDNGGFDSDEIDFDDGEEVSQETVLKKLRELYSGWYNYKSIGMVISWSRIEEKKGTNQEEE